MVDYQMPLNHTISSFVKPMAIATENKNWQILKSMQLMMNILLDFKSTGMSIKDSCNKTVEGEPEANMGFNLYVSFI